MTRYVLVFSFVFFTAFAFAARDERIKVVIEEPIAGAKYSSLSNLRGWTVSPAGVGRFYMHVYVDGEFAFYIAPFGNRPDVGNAFPDYPNSDYGGFSTAYNYKNLAQGEHRIRVRVFDDAGNYNDRSVTFSTERFKSSFIGDKADIDLSTTTRTAWYDEQSLLVKRATIEGEEWDFLLRWDRASQSFKTEGIYRSEEQYYSDSGGFELSSGFSPGAPSGTSSGSGGGTTGTSGSNDGSSASSGDASTGESQCLGFGCSYDTADGGGDVGGVGGSSSGGYDSGGDESGGGFDVSSGGSGSSADPVFSPSPGSGTSSGGGDAGGDGGNDAGSDGGDAAGSTSTTTTDPCDTAGYNPSCTPSTSSSSSSTSTGSSGFGSSGGSSQTSTTTSTTTGAVTEVVVNVDARRNGVSNPVEVYLTAGRYKVVPIGPEEGGSFTARNAWNGSVSSCTGFSGICNRGWQHGALIYSTQVDIASTRYHLSFGIRHYVCDARQQKIDATKSEYGIEFLAFSSAERALDWHKSAWTGCELSISGSGNVKFADGDSNTADNQGGSSFKLVRQ